MTALIIVMIIIFLIWGFIRLILNVSIEGIEVDESGNPTGRKIKIHQGKIEYIEDKESDK